MAEMSEAAKKFLRDLNKARQNEARSTGQAKSDKQVAQELRKMAAQIERSKGSDSAPAGRAPRKPVTPKPPVGGKPVPGKYGKSAPTVSKSTKKNISGAQARSARAAGQAMTGSTKAQDRLTRARQQSAANRKSDPTGSVAKTLRNVVRAATGKKKGN